MGKIANWWRGVRAALSLTFTQSSGTVTAAGGSLFNTDLSRNSIVVACIRWIQRNISEAPPILQQWRPDAEEWEDVPYPLDDPPGTRVLTLLRRPNDCYPGTSLWKATMEDLVLTGNGYWVLQRVGVGTIGAIWWVPAARMMPRASTTSPLGSVDYYEMTVGAERRRYPVEDVVHFRDGLDPENPCLGKPGIASIIQEVLLDEKASSMATTLMTNAGHAGAILAPDAGTIPQEAARRIEETYDSKFKGGGAGSVMVTPAKLNVQTIAYTPAQLEMRAQRSVPEERVSAVIGTNPAVVGLGSGLATTKVGATLAEYREEAFESTIIPWYRDLQEHITQQLLPRFGLEQGWRMQFDLRGIRVLQEDQMKRTERVARLVTDGIITVAEGRRDLGYPVKPEHEIYLRPANERMIPAGQPLRVQTEQPSPTPIPDEAMALLTEPEAELLGELVAKNGAR